MAGEIVTNKITTKLLGPAWSRAFRCIWMLEEIGISYELIDTARPWSRETKRFHSTGKVPILLEYSSDPVHDPLQLQHPSFVLTESIAINTYLGDTYGAHSVNDRGTDVTDFHPSDPSDETMFMPRYGTRERAKYDEALCCILSELDAALWVHRKHTKHGLGQFFGEIPNVSAPAAANFHRVNALLAVQCQPYLLGSHFTPADIAYVHCLDWAVKEEWHNTSDLWPSNVIQNYLSICHQRPAYQRAHVIRSKSVASSGAKL